MRIAITTVAAALAATLASPVAAATVTTDLGVRIVIQGACTIAVPSDLDFGTRGVLAANVDVSTTLSVTCSNTLPYNIGLDAGDGSGSTVTSRKMTGPASATVNYGIFRDASRSLNWGDTVGTDTLAGTGNGSAQTINVYGRVPPQTTPAAGTYTDTVLVTVTY